jgi:hypothetical protein
MSIISGNRNRSKMSYRGHDYVNANIASAMREPSKRELQAMLAEAAKNTAEISTEEGGDDALDH